MTGNKDREFIVLRQNALQQFLNFIVTHRILRHSLALKHFLHPSLYAGDYQGRAFIQFFFKMCTCIPTARSIFHEYGRIYMFFQNWHYKIYPWLYDHYKNMKLSNIYLRLDGELLRPIIRYFLELYLNFDYIVLRKILKVMLLLYRSKIRPIRKRKKSLLG